MARLNITLPDVLYARLEQLRDRINLSKVCALALEKEVKMLEGQPNITDPRIARLLQRLQSTRERWYQRGYDDGFQWAVELATRDELQSVATHLEEMDVQKLASLFHKSRNVAFMTAQAFPPHMHPPMPPGGMEARTIMYGHKQTAPAMPPMPPMPPGPKFAFPDHVGIPFPGFPQSFHPAERIQHWEGQDREMSGQAPQDEAARVEVDETAYLEGWRDAIKGVWQTIAPALS